MQFFRIFFWGFLISLLGSLPLGTLNVMAMQLSINEGVMPAVWFSLGALLVEMIYVRISLVGIAWVRKEKRIFRWLEWAGLFVVLLLAIGSFVSAASPTGPGHIIFENELPRFILGAVLSMLNPMQIPFWFAWSTVLFSKNILLPSRVNYNYYVAGIGLGTLCGHLFFIFSGRLLMDWLRIGQQYLNWAVGAIFAVTALILFIKIVLHRDPVSKL